MIEAVFMAVHNYNNQIASFAISTVQTQSYSFYYKKGIKHKLEHLANSFSKSI